MSGIRWFPQSFFSRTLWLMLMVLLLSKALTLVYLMANEDVLVDRQYSYGAALMVKAFWITDDNSRPVLMRATGIRWLPSDKEPVGEYHWPYSEIFQQQMRDELGPETETRLQVTANNSSLWVYAPNLGDGWLEITMQPHPLRGQRIWSVLGWFLGIALLSMGAAWIFVGQLSEPLKQLVYAARQLGRGRKVRLPETETLSEMTEVYRAFNQMAEDVELAGRERELMLAGVSHDLRTPLTRLRLSVELMKENEFTRDMVRDIEDMNSILDQFIAFIRDGSDEPLEDIDLNNLLEEVVNPFNGEEDRVHLHQDILPIIPLRRVAIKRMLTNLINNALHYSHANVELVATLAGQGNATYVQLSVLDKGPGIDPEELKNIFNPFTRGELARSASQGAGLGLAIVKRIVIQHGGNIELLNRPEGGLEARIRLPLTLMLPREAQ